MVEQRAQRRLAAILAADVVGYSRLMEADEIGTMTAIKSRRRGVLEPLVAKHHGRVFKIAGDGVLVEFASAVNAVQCAVDLQQGMASANEGQPGDRQIVLRVGVNLGDVMVEGGDLYGDGVNIAARLEAIADPGGILVSGTAYDQVGTKVKVGFDNLGAQALKNFAQPVRAYRVNDTPEVAVKAPKPATDKPSIAVLPLTNMSGDPEQEYFSEGLAEDIITELGRFRSLLIISSKSSFVFKGESIDVKEIAQKLGARYIVEGSVRRFGNRMRITVQLLESATGKYLWAERYDRSVEDYFNVQDEITQMIVASLPAHIDEAERARAPQRASESFSAYDHWLRGKHLLSGDRSKDEVLRARHHFEKAIELDPGFGSAYVELAGTYAAEHDSAWSKSREAALQQVLKLSQQGVNADPRDSRTHLYLAWGYLNVSGDYELAKVQVDEAIALNPNDYFNYCFGGWLAACSGDLDRAVACSNEAVRRSPIVSDGCLETRVAAEYLAGNYAESITAFGKMLRPRGVMYGWIAAAYAQLGRAGEARAMADEFRRRVRELSQTPKDDDPVEWHRFWNVDFPTKDPAAREHFFNGLRKAGLPV